MKKKKNKKGSALAYALIIILVVSVITTSMLMFISSQMKFSFSRVSKEKAFQIAEAGAYYYRWYLAHQTTGKTAQQIQNFWQNGNPIGVATPYEKDYEGVGKYRLEVEAPSPGSTIVTVKSTGWTYKEPNVLRKVKVRFRRPSWSEYVFLSNSFMNFGNQATVYGKVHSNNGIHFDGIAYNTVSSLLPRFNCPVCGGSRMKFGVHTTRNPADGDAPSYPWSPGTVPSRPDVFVGGREFPTAEISFNGVTTDLANAKLQAQAGFGRYFDTTGSGRRINLKSDGTYDICTVNSAQQNTRAISNYAGIITGATGSYSGTNGNACVTNNCCSFSSCPNIQQNRPERGRCVSLANYPIIDNGVIFVENNVWLEGNVNNKRITVVAANLSGGGSQADIYIGISNNNLRLAAYDCNNMLGLVAQRDILILNDCPDNFIVDAALLAQTGRVGIINGMGGKYLLTFNGAITSYLQPYFQSGNSGFANRVYNFNNNLLYCPPPYFPTGSEYFIDLWEEL